MKTVQEKNKETRRLMEALTDESRDAGVACDICGTEMQFTDPNMLLACIPPKRKVQCPKCGRIDYLIC